MLSLTQNSQIDSAKVLPILKKLGSCHKRGRLLELACKSLQDLEQGVENGALLVRVVLMEIQNETDDAKLPDIN